MVQRFEPSTPLRVLAVTLADTGEHETWAEIAEALADEGYKASLIQAFGKDRATQVVLAARIVEARKRRGLV